GGAAGRMAEQALRISAVGDKATVRQRLDALIEEYRPNELILTGQIHDPEARMHSFRLAAEVLDDMFR
ncbi:MAG: alkane 1-monooxygenase, partial [Paracoccus sp. (in: a-proteobacteria)]|nr:alkane 1-monooxygenase [Paracoccus sp. (in: a-proteobacteria)]